MGDKTRIEWADATWSPVTGCTRVSDGCLNCYIERSTPIRVAGRKFDGEGIGASLAVQLHPNRLDWPLRKRDGKKIFVCSQADLFHDDVPDEYIARVFAVMALAPQHTFQVLTKRHGRMRSLLSSDDFRSQVTQTFVGWAVEDFSLKTGHLESATGDWWPLPNVWLGVSAEDQKRADLRIPALLDTPAAVRFVSAEPLLGPIDLHGDPIAKGSVFWIGHLDWVIVGGESGPGARPMHPDWARSMRDQCVAAGVPFLFKQWGEWSPEDGLNWSEGNGRRLHYARNYLRSDGTCAVLGDDGRPGVCMERVGKRRTGRELDGRTWDQYPEVQP
ncbi:phage Gp37/Gp68 family protein [Mycobacteroides abscessus]|uniref:phage Gp37/Gp68 family protein n=1 Tax=Mycobacteroides abscessus TaxID=36809 RepID=UPI0009A68A00|nr:phage Gp37/Gp68 family protein [Mycobacteroides abscessus]MBN7468640.1 phage Gp37/Gp68 family protein [Mycobacteroides abscessus subsp. massiliense]QSM02859.1 RNA methyltransferase [Mycobacterium phage prophi58-1]SLD29360.1 bacteriophage protein gp37 [Mycobacteroides abscessus subsp. massiliense]SLD39552.1 bacteriophage protein gp37 [Mycobacteroides abscessus subsp. massiliense]